MVLRGLVHPALLRITTAVGLLFVSGCGRQAITALDAAVPERDGRVRDQGAEVQERDDVSADGSGTCSGQVCAGSATLCLWAEPEVPPMGPHPVHEFAGMLRLNAPWPAFPGSHPVCPRESSVVVVEAPGRRWALAYSIRDGSSRREPDLRPFDGRAVSVRYRGRLSEDLEGRGMVVRDEGGILFALEDAAWQPVLREVDLGEIRISRGPAACRCGFCGIQQYWSLAVVSGEWTVVEPGRERRVTIGAHDLVVRNIAVYDWPDGVRCTDISEHLAWAMWRVP